MFLVHSQTGHDPYQAVPTLIGAKGIVNRTLKNPLTPWPTTKAGRLTSCLEGRLGPKLEKRKKAWLVEKMEDLASALFLNEVFRWAATCCSDTALEPLHSPAPRTGALQ